MRILTHGLWSMKIILSLLLFNITLKISILINPIINRIYNHLSSRAYLLNHAKHRKHTERLIMQFAHNHLYKSLKYSSPLASTVPWSSPGSLTSVSSLFLFSQSPWEISDPLLPLSKLSQVASLTLHFLHLFEWHSNLHPHSEHSS